MAPGRVDRALTTAFLVSGFGLVAFVVVGFPLPVALAADWTNGSASASHTRACAAGAVLSRHRLGEAAVLHEGRRACPPAGRPIAAGAADRRGPGRVDRRAGVPVVTPRASAAAAGLDVAKVLATVDRVLRAAELRDAVQRLGRDAAAQFPDFRVIHFRNTDVGGQPAVLGVPTFTPPESAAPPCSSSRSWCSHPRRRTGRPETPFNSIPTCSAKLAGGCAPVFEGLISSFAFE